MNSTKQRYNYRFFEPLLIITFWTLLFASPLLFGRFEDVIDWPHVFTVWLNYLPLLLLFLLNRFYLVPKLFFKGKKKQYFIITLGLIILFSSIIYLWDRNVIDRSPEPPGMERVEGRPPRGLSPHESPPPGRRPQGRNTPPPNIDRPLKTPRPVPLPAYFFILAFLMVGFDTGLQIAMKWAKLEQEKVNLEKESIENQLAFLKNQVSPHFFMNTLNNIHALVDFDKEKAKNSIVKLSSLMRHLLYDSENKTTPIEKEVTFINSYVELMRLRFSNRVDIRVNIPNELPDKNIPPLLFTSLLENAFKHGISYKEPSYISIVMNFTENDLNFEIENSKHQKASDDISGIGLKNTKQRLNLLYKNNYLLEITQNDSKFKVNLKIPI